MPATISYEITLSEPGPGRVGVNVAPITFPKVSTTISEARKWWRSDAKVIAFVKSKADDRVDTTAKVARHPERDSGKRTKEMMGLGYQSYTFVPVGAFPKDQGVVSVFLTDDAFSHGDGTPPGTPADDYPNLVVRSAPTRTAIANTTTDASDDAWDTCRKSKAVAACAKAHPSEYAKLHTLYDAATKAAAAP